MPTQRQRKAAEKLVENGGNVSKAMRDAGYSKQTAKSPHKLTDSKGFIELCDAIGLTDDLLVRALVEDIKSKAGERKAELELGFKVRGLLKERHEHSGKDGGPLTFLDMSKLDEAPDADSNTNEP